MVVSGAWRWPVVSALLLGDVALHAGVVRGFGTGIALWFFVAVGLGFVVGRWWSLILAALPWPLGIGVGLASGRYVFLGDAWQVVALLSLLVGLGGTTLGVATSKARSRG